MFLCTNVGGVVFVCLFIVDLICLFIYCLFCLFVLCLFCFSWGFWYGFLVVFVVCCLFCLVLPRTKVGVPYNDFKHCINQYIFSTWQDDWNGAVMNKLHSVKPVLGDWQSSYRRCRRDEVVLCRARIGHTHLTHSYILRKDPPPLCEHCQCILTVRHILAECNHFAQERKDIFGRRDVVESFRCHPTLIVLFLKQIELYYKF